MKKLIPQKIKNVYHFFKSILAVVFFGFPTRKMKMIGVTGTNGKTTTTTMIAKILESAGKKVAVFSTIQFGIGEDKKVNKTKFTTLSAWKLQQMAKEAARKNCEYLVLEVASHAIDQHRIWGIEFDAAVITNVTREHLDYHKTMKEYRKAKLKLFDKVKKKGAVVVNSQMQSPEDFLAKGQKFQRRSYVYGVETIPNLNISKKQNSRVQKVVAENVSLSLNGLDFEIQGQKFHLNLIGRFNIENALAAVSAGLSQSVDLATMAQALGEIEKVPGRVDKVENDRGIEIIVDYAVTPDSIKKLGQLVREMMAANPDRKVIWVFGSCGDRDRGKRPIMGEIVAEYSDFAIVTNEDPYTEDPKQIIEEVFAGVVNFSPKDESQRKIDGQNAWRIFDRRQAIQKALEMARKGDLVLVTGKGAEEAMMIGHDLIPWNDQEVIEEELKKLQ